MSDTSLEAYHSMPIPVLQDKERQVMAAFTGCHVTYTRQQLARAVRMPINAVCGRVRSLLDKGCLVVRGEQRCRTTGKYRELVGLPEAR